MNDTFALTLTIFGLLAPVFGSLYLLPYVIPRRKPEYIYGICNDLPARKNKRTGAVQFVYWRKGDQSYIWNEEHKCFGHECDKWIDFDPSWWPLFIADKEQQQ